MISLKIITLIVLFCLLGSEQKIYGLHPSHDHQEDSAQHEIKIVKDKHKIEMKKRKKRRSKNKKILMSEPIGVKRLHDPNIQKAVRVHREKKAREIKEKIERIDDEKRRMKIYKSAMKMDKEAVIMRRRQLEKAEQEESSQAHLNGLSNIIDQLEAKIDSNKEIIAQIKKKIKAIESSMTLEEIRDAEEVLGTSLLKVAVND